MYPESAIRSPLSAVAILTASAGVYQRTIMARYCPCAGSPRIAQISAPQPVLTLYFFGLRSREHFQRRHSAGGQSGGSLLGSQFQRSMLRQTLLAKSD